MTRVVYGARTTLLIAVCVITIGGLFATMVGLFTTYIGGPVDYLWQRLVDGLMSIPILVLMLGVLSLVSPSILNLVIALSVRFGITNTRYVRASTLAVLSAGYVESARVIGGSPIRIVLRHILPNVSPIIIVLLSFEIGVVILIEASLSFLGFGVRPPSPTWGGMLGTDGRAYLTLAPWMLIAPGIALSLVVFSVNIFGDALRDALDPRLRKA